MSQQKTVVITGANKGIGLEFVRFYQNAGWHVYAVCRKPSSELMHLNVTIIEGVDISLDESIEQLATRLSHDKIDLLINNAGAWCDSTLGEIDYGMLLQNININALGTLRVTEALLPFLNTNAKIAIITSKMGSNTDNTSGGRYGYRMAKAALNAAAKSLSVDLKSKGIAVVLLHPGWVLTEMGGKNALITTEQSISGMTHLIDKANLDSSGEFLAYDGKTIPW